MSHNARTIQLQCPAKVNLALSVGAPHADGMHPIASLMCALSFGDQMSLTTADGDSCFDIQFVPLTDDDTQPMGVVDWPLEKDLAFRALGALEEHVGRKLPVKAEFRKRIPAGAGLAGGSGNAAGLLVGVNRLYNLNLSTTTLAKLAQKLGSDVVFVVHVMQEQLTGAIVSGLGQRIKPLRLKQVVHMVLIFPPFGCPTRAVYDAFDRMTDNPAKQADLPMVHHMANSPLIQPSDPFNDLAEPACEIQPELGKFQRQLTDGLQLPVHITGSGSTMFIISPNIHTAKVTARSIREEYDLKAIATRTM